MDSKLITLVVEDHGFQRRTMAIMLRSLGVQRVLEACDGTQALALMHDLAPATVDLILCDLNMRGMDGMELIRHLGEVNSTASVVILSAEGPALLASVEKMTQAYNIRLLGVIEKPASLDQFRDIIARHKQFRPKPKQVASGTPGFGINEILSGVQHKEFEPFFQPKISLVTDRVLGAEALARWRHPVHGVVSPYEFIPLLEKTGNINELTYQMLEKSAQACCGWRKKGHDWTVSVNLSLVSLTDVMLADRITEIVRSTRFDPRYMTLEITESAAMSNVAQALENLVRLRMHGFGLSIDDYGTGYASMQQLTRIPFTELKIDRSFVTGCVTNDATRAIVESSVGMAHRLGIKSVAEGVESQADWDVLKAVNCDVAQGYFVAKPMDASSFLEFCGTYQHKQAGVKPVSVDNHATSANRGNRDAVQGA
ncbi:MAG: EAL domain-containing response regulator [Candidatus Nitrotoga sp.]